MADSVKARREPKIWLRYLIAVYGLTAVYLTAHFTGPAFLNSGAVYNVIGGSTVVALVVGARRNAPDYRWPWYLCALGQAFFVTGDVLAYNYQSFFGRPLPFPGIDDAFYLAFYPLLVGGVLLLIRKGNAGRNRAALIDSLIVTIAAGAMSWIYLMAPYAHDASLKLDTKLTAIAYPLMDVLVLGVVLRLAVGSRRRGPAFTFLVVGAFALVVSDALYGWFQLHGGYNTGALLDGGWALFYGLLGATALHPSMRELVEPAPEPDERLSRNRLVALTGATLAAPIVLIARGTLGNSVDSYVLVATSIVLFSLVLMRLTGLVHRNEEAARREAALRLGGEALVTAVGRKEIYSAALQAARSVVDEDVVAYLYVTNGSPGKLVPVGSSDGSHRRLEELRLDELPAGAAESVRERRVTTVERRGRMVSIAPLFIRDELTGLLSVASPVALKRSVQEGLATLATEVALALQSASLAEIAHDQRSEARLTALVENSSDVICIVGTDAGVRYLSPSVDRTFGHEPATLRGAPIVNIVHPDETDRVLSFIEEVAARVTGDGQTTQLRLRHADGSWRDVEVLATNLLRHEAIEGIVLNVRDVTERNELNHRAFHDPLTNLPNRLLFRNRLEHALAAQVRNGLPVAVLYVDIDNFKDVNDGFGHAAGDRVLQEVARRLDECLRPADTAARLGGDEFAVLIQGSPNESDTIEIAHRIRAALAAAVLLDGQQVPIAASIGVALGAQGGPLTRDAAGLLQDADAAMYVAKQSKSVYGRCAVFEPSMRDHARLRQGLRGELQRALDNGEFTLCYQPIIDLIRGDMAGMEALARWHHPTRGNVPPVEFVPLMEETGLIVPLGQQILLEACRHAARLQQECPRDPPLSISVNVSASQLQRAEFVEEVREVLLHTGIPPSSLIIELTESVLMGDTDLSVKRMSALRSVGVRLAVDDFGTGYSSLMYLRRFPVDIIKIDRSFIADPSPKALELTATMIQMARVCELEAVVEGVETAAHLERIRAMRTEFGQGFYFAKPLPGEEILALAVEQSLGRFVTPDALASGA